MESTIRNPRLLLKFSGLFLLRQAQRAFLLLLIQEPPRTTRIVRRLTRCRDAARVYYTGNVRFQPPNSLPISATMPAAWRY